MKILLLISLLILSTTRQDFVLICQSDAAYAFHLKECTGLKKCTHQIEKVTKDYALKEKRTPCKYCYGPNGEPAEQCKAFTKENNPCSRNAVIKGFCKQHAKMKGY